MNRKFSGFKRAAILLAAISAASVSSTASAEWSITGLGTLGGTESYASRVNNSGQVVGYSYAAGNGIWHAFLTGPNGVGMTDLGSFGQGSSANSINDAGQVVGWMGADWHPYITGPNGVGINGIGVDGWVYGINNSGQVAGIYYPPAAGGLHAFITGPNGIGITDLGTLGGSLSHSYDINDSGQVVGQSYIAGNTAQHAFLTGPNGAGMTDLGTLGGNNSWAFGINNSGQVAGRSYTAGDTANHAFLTGANGVGMTDLGTMGGTWSGASSVNSAGQAVGWSYLAGDATAHSFLYSNGVMTDLNLLAPVVAAGWTDLSTTDINDFGQIVGHGVLNGTRQAFLLSGALDGPFPDWRTQVPPLQAPPPPVASAVPEPETYAMLLAGLVLMGIVALRRRSQLVISNRYVSC